MAAFTALASLLGAVFSDMVSQETHGGGLHYEASARRQLRPGTGERFFRGRSVVWIGPVGRMLWVPAADLYPREDNIFHARKITEATALVERASEDNPVPFIAGYGLPTILSAFSIGESQQYRDDPGPTWSTGDSELDAWLADPEGYVDEHFDEHYDEDDEDWEDEDLARQNTRAAMADLEARAVAEQWGDIGRLVVQVRDANHRIAGAILGGEPGAWIKIPVSEIRGESMIARRVRALLE